MIAGAIEPGRLALPDAEAPLLHVSGLHVSVRTGSIEVEILHGIELIVPVGGRVGIVGESGSGKSMTAGALLRLLPRGLRMTSGRLGFADRDLATLTEREMRAVRGREISIVYQQAMASLNPLFPVGKQIAMVCRAHTGLSRGAADRRAVEMLDALGIAEPERRAKDYPHQFSGGMAQRVAIAMALVCGPRLLICDEPTTGLDATIQAQVLETIDGTIQESGAALLLISHDLAVITAMCELVTVVYAGQVLEFGTTEQILHEPASPYTQGLVRCLATETAEIAYIPGRIPEPGSIGERCPFLERCSLASDRCRNERPRLRELHSGHWVACHNVEAA